MPNKLINPHRGLHKLLGDRIGYETTHAALRAWEFVKHAAPWGLFYAALIGAGYLLAGLFR